MNTIELVVALSTALGAGAILKTLLDAWLNRTKNQIDTNLSLRNEIRLDLDRARQRLDALEQENDSLILKNAKLEGTVTVISAQLDMLQGEKNRLHEELGKLHQSNRDLLHRMQEVQKENAQLREHLRAVEEDNIRLATRIGLIHDENRLLRSVLDRNGIVVPELRRVTDYMADIVTPPQKDMGGPRFPESTGRIGQSVPDRPPTRRDDDTPRNVSAET